MADRARFRRLFRRFLPAWATTGDGELVHYSIGATLDLWFERLREGIRARFPSHAPDDALSLIGKDRKIVRGIEEPRASYVERLIRAPDDHRTRGNPYALMRQLRAYCQTDLRIRTVDRNGNWYTIEADGTQTYHLAQGNWDWQGETTAQWSRFWVILYPPASLWTKQNTLGSGLILGTPGLTIGSSATPEQVRSVKQIVRDWKPDGTRCVRIILAFNDGDFDPLDANPPNPDGDWNISSRRNPDAAYWNPAH